jgi:hypothetical protein
LAPRLGAAQVKGGAENGFSGALKCQKYYWVATMPQLLLGAQNSLSYEVRV